ncbi:PQQ-dependent sugar dehydrogenase [Qipengyuania mesophila]|uniref:PQQ-dependent sugar dehydrogenase n=1 Tax=Qipengyuania mesophila TaxID=2867246 RepID=UPI0035190641
MTHFPQFATTLALAIGLASCGNAASVDTQPVSSPTVTDPAAFDGDFAIEEIGSYAEPWAVAVIPGTEIVVVTEKAGGLKGYDAANGKALFFTGAPQIDYGGQGGMGDVAFQPSEAGAPLSGRAIYLSWAEAGEDNTRGAVVGRGTLSCEDHQTCAIEGLKVIWRQDKVTGRGHYSHRIAFSPDGQHIFVASGDRQKMEPAQDTTNNLGSIVRLALDGTPASDNPLADRDGASVDIWSWGHRNILGLAFDAQGRLWDMEHGPRGGDELNLVRRGANYGWPRVSDGMHYDGTPIPNHDTSDAYARPAITWTPVIAPGSMIFYRGALFPGMQGDALIAGLSSNAIIRVEIDGASAREVARYPMGTRIRGVTEGPDGALWVIEDGEGGRLLRLTPG